MSTRISVNWSIRLSLLFVLMLHYGIMRGVCMPDSILIVDGDSVSNQPVASVTTDVVEVPDSIETPQEFVVNHKRKSLPKRIIDSLYKFVKNFSRVDTNYIEPQKFNYTVMLQNTNTYELYTVRTPRGNDITFSPQPSVKLGPYIGWRWVFLGYTLDLNHISNGNKKTEFDLSLYSAQIGIDLFYRRTGTDYRISKLTFGAADAQHFDTHSINGTAYDGINVGIKGFNLYYIFNHKRFSYPAAFSQSTIQRRSCGSALCGIGYTKHSLSIDWEKLYAVAADKFGNEAVAKYMDADLKNKRIKYTDVSLSGGYAYNWVFAHGWLAAASLSVALAYKTTTGNENRNTFSFRDFSLHNFNIDGVGRFGVVWNNMRWYAGANAIVHTYNYKKPEFSTNNMFGSINIYVGVNFGRIK